MTRVRRRRRRRVGAALLGFGLLGLFATSSPAETDTSAFSQFSVSARADLFQLDVYEDRAPVIPPGQAAVELSPATAQTVLDSLGTSSGFASAPYPGETVTGLPGLLNGMADGNLPLPAYPVIVSTDHPREKDAELDHGVYRLQSTSSSTSSEALAAFGAGEQDVEISIAGRVRARVEISQDRIQDRIVGTAVASMSGLEIPDIITIGDVTSTATVTVAAGDEPEGTTTFHVDVIRVAGVEVEIDQEGLRVADAAVPLDPSSVDELLAKTGVRLEYVPQETVRAGPGAMSVHSAGLRLEALHTLPDGQSTRLVFDLGRAVATVGTRPAVPAASRPPVADDPMAQAPTPPRPRDAAAPAPAVSDVPPPAKTVPPPAKTEGHAPATPRPHVAEPELSAAPQPLDPGPTLAGIYGVMVLGGLLALGAGQLLGQLGIRLRFRGNAAGL